MKSCVYLSCTPPTATTLSIHRCEKLIKSLLGLCSFRGCGESSVGLQDWFQFMCSNLDELPEIQTKEVEPDEPA